MAEARFDGIELGHDTKLFLPLMIAVLTKERMIANLSAVFCLLATLLAILGLYGVMSYTVAGRTREIGIRMALGAQRRNVIAMVMPETAVLVFAGLAGGVAAALLLTRLLTTQLFGVAPNDPVTLMVAGALLALIAGAAGYLPARRASQVDPMLALRHE